MRTLELTDEQYEVVKKIVELRKDMDRRFTHLPFYSVQTRRDKMCDSSGEYGGDPVIIECYDGDKTIIENRKDFLEIIGFEEEDVEGFEDWYIERLDDMDFKNLDEVCEMINIDPETGEDKDETIYSIYYTEDDYEDVAFFLTEQEAFDYCKYQSHNLDNPRTYGHATGYANRGYFPKLLQILDELNLEG